MKGTQTKSIIPYLKGGKYSMVELIKKSKLKESTIRHDLQSLLNLGVIGKTKIDKTYYYFILEKELERKHIDIDEIYNKVEKKAGE